ncbi:MAG: SLC13 family permease [Desulfovibrionaceae bacterium]|nr:SLC13 family permease [Desulfovibrionaceae bacterium]
MKRFILPLTLLLLAVLLAAGPEAVTAAPGMELKLPEDYTKAYITLGILLVAAVMFFTEVVPLPVTALLVPVALSLTKVISSKVAFSFFGDPTVVLFMAMFIVGEATFVTGFADKVGGLAVRLSRGNPIRLLLFTMLAVGLLSTCLSNTGTTAVAVPMILAMCLTAKVAPGKILMPVAFASSLGGTVTLVGTPPNGIINSMLAQTGQTPFGFFEFGLIGVPLLIAGLLYYCLIGHRLLPKGRELEETDDISEVRKRRLNKMPYAIGIFVFVVVMMASELMPLTTAAVLGACLIVITGCLNMREAYHSVDWNTIFLFAGMLSMSAAMSQSGAALIVANAVVSTVHDPWMLMLACCALTGIITNFMSNTATAALMAPLAMPIAAASGISPLPITMGIAMSASACFLTPIATPPNTIVLGPGKYRFMDYVKAGWPLQLIVLLMCWLLIPLIWPFHP